MLGKDSNAIKTTTKGEDELLVWLNWLQDEGRESPEKGEEKPESGNDNVKNVTDDVKNVKLKDNTIGGKAESGKESSEKQSEKVDTSKSDNLKLDKRNKDTNQNTKENKEIIKIGSQTFKEISKKAKDLNPLGRNS